MSRVVYFLKGLPASGKSSWAFEYIKNNPGYKRVNKDDLRAMIDAGVWSRANEKFILKLQDFLITEYLEAGFHVIVDNTNFAPEHEERIRQVVRMWSKPNNKEVDFRVKFFEVDVEEAIVRDLKRQASVGEKVIRDMHKKYLAPKPEVYNPKAILGPMALIVDLDGTLCKMKNRGPFDWHLVGEDECNTPVQQILTSWAFLHTDPSWYKVIIVSGRDEVCRKETEDWLKLHLPPIVLDRMVGPFMRPAGDNRKDTIVKKEIYDREIRDKYFVEFVLDDRASVVEMWRQLGLTCLQVAEGSF